MIAVEATFTALSGGNVMKLFDVKGKRAIVTGGSRGLGGAMAAGLMEHGCKVAVIAASPQTS